MELTKGTILYLYVGKQGYKAKGGWNGGGDGLGHGPKDGVEIFLKWRTFPNGRFNKVDYVEWGRKWCSER